MHGERRLNPADGPADKAASRLHLGPPAKELMIGADFEQVLAAAQANAGWAFTRLYEDIAPAVFGYLKVQGMREPEDTTSEVFLAAFSRLGSFTGTGAGFRSFVFTIAHRRIVDERRAGARRPAMEALGDDSTSPQADAAATAEHDALARMGTQRVQEVLARLPPDQAHVLSLRIIADLTVEQVAVALDKSPGAVKALQRRALDVLRQDLSSRGVTL